MIEELWKDINGYDYPYQVSNFGRIKGMKGFMKPYDNGYGYLVVELKQNKKSKHLRVHRLVANAFIPNPLNFQKLIILTKINTITLWEILNGVQAVITKHTETEEKCVPKE